MKKSKPCRGGASGSKSRKSARSDVPQLGQQPKQSIPPLKVLSENVPPLLGQNMEEAAKLAADMGVTVEALLGGQDDELPMAVVAPKPIYVKGKPLVSKDRLRQLPTYMRKLHEWYMTADKMFIIAKVPREYYFRPEEIHVEFDELFQMYNFDALDKSLMSCYCL